MAVTGLELYRAAERYVGIRELSDDKENHPLVQWWHSLCGLGWNQDDETPWCSSFVNGVAWQLRLPRSKSARARSWLGVGVRVPKHVAKVGDIVILSRGTLPQPGPEVQNAPGHVGILAQNGIINSATILGGNQGNMVSVAEFPVERVLGVRRITE